MNTEEMNGKNIATVDTDDLEKVYAGSEPPKYASPKGEERAREVTEKMREEIKNSWYLPSGKDSELMIYDDSLRRHH